jgi:hypothetical protein
MTSNASQKHDVRRVEAGKAGLIRVLFFPPVFLHGLDFSRKGLGCFVFVSSNFVHLFLVFFA